MRGSGESSFATGIPGDNVDPCKQDCFFDGNSGMGDDGCQRQLECDPRSTNTRCLFSQSYVDKHMTERSATASVTEVHRLLHQVRPQRLRLLRLLHGPGAPTPIRLDPTCTAKDFGDPTKSSPCTQVTQCMNTCDRCELCVGKTSVPEECTAGGTTRPDGSPPGDADGTPSCTGGFSCVPRPNAVCPTGYGCLAGCCVPVIP